MPGPQPPAHHVRAHPAQPDHCDLHLALLTHTVSPAGRSHFGNPGRGLVLPPGTPCCRLTVRSASSGSSQTAMRAAEGGYAGPSRTRRPAQPAPGTGLGPFADRVRRPSSAHSSGPTRRPTTRFREFGHADALIAWGYDAWPREWYPRERAGERVAAARAAAGGRPAQRRDVRHHVTAAKQVPARLLVLGGGVVGAEMAQAYR